MRKGALALFLLLLTFASHDGWCSAAARSAMAEEDAAHHHLRPHHLETQGKSLLEMQSPRKVGRATGGAGAGGGGGRNTGGGATDTRPHNGKNIATALPAPATSVLALVFTTSTILLSALSF
ncbi:uncharacterized protein LOC125545356 [Triticum urartu]|uniref:Uncharacterized protein n=1 Tax=Triticum urartu TaxID=4572 RepID=A0A8R7P0L2_TRIUA|nr:uncharacterized protein LOC119362223 [Triticum dicoccoides]XP_048565232.1 uncharacterized protein LOC125545356 [Triticum urartu]